MVIWSGSRSTRDSSIVQHALRLLINEPFLGRSELVLDLTGVVTRSRTCSAATACIGKVTITAGNDELVGERGIHYVASRVPRQSGAHATA